MLKPLTSFRFFAAILVFLYHVGIWKYYQTGYLGVTFFFILSGFILAYNYRSKFRQLDFHEIKDFYIARIAKIYPVHILTFILSIPFYFFLQLKYSVYLYILQAFTNILLLQSYLPIGNFSFNGPSWSISDEFFFYAIFPILLFLSLKYINTTKKKFICLILLWITMTLIAVLCSSIKMQQINTWIFYIFPVTRLFDFFVGVILGLIFFKINVRKIKIGKIVFTILELFSLMMVAFVIFLSPNISYTLRFSLFFVPFLSLLIFMFAFQGGFFSDLLSNRIFVYLGEVSFSFYMIHNLVISYSFWSLLKLSITPITIIGCFLITFFLSSLLYQFYEEPLRRKIRNASINKKVLKDKIIPELTK